MTAPSDVETLREAARVLRDRAEAATDSTYRWRPTGEERVCEVWAPRDAADYDAFMVATTLTRLNRNPSARAQADADHIAAADPTFTRAVADWLDQHSGDHDVYDCRWEPCAALAVARAYLRTAHPRDADMARERDER